jgi:hypothetical protein
MQIERLSTRIDEAVFDDHRWVRGQTYAEVFTRARDRPRR